VREAPQPAVEAWLRSRLDVLMPDMVAWRPRWQPHLWLPPQDCEHGPLQRCFHFQGGCVGCCLPLAHWMRRGQQQRDLQRRLERVQAPSSHDQLVRAQHHGQRHGCNRG